jgi:hypothetical protein
MLKLPPTREQRLERIGLGACVLATLLAVCLHVVYLTHALGASDFTLRILGFLIGLGLLGAVWVNAGLLGIRWPVVSLALLAANVTVVRWGDSLRAYGCGSLFILLTLGLIWRLVRKPGVASFLLASLAATLSVQSLYSNAFLVLAACLAGCAVCARHRQWKTTMRVLGVGLLAAVSLVPYVSVIMATRDDRILHQMGFRPDFAWDSLSLALGSGLGWPLWVWLGLSSLVFGVAWELRLKPAKGSSVGTDVAWFGVSALVAGLVLFFVFLRVSELPAETWYYLPLMVFVATALDAALSNWFRQLGFWPPVLAMVIVCAMFPAALKLAKYRQTNLDLIAAELHRRAQPGDLIVVSPAYCGISFARYFKAPVAWTTLPPVDDHRCHRVDLLRANLGSKPLPKGVLDQAERALASGHRLWVVAALSPPEPGEVEPPDLPPAPPPGQPLGWAEGCLRGYIWERQIAHLIDAHAQATDLIRLGPATGVIPQEDLPLVVATGWRGEPGNTPAQP